MSSGIRLVYVTAATVEQAEMIARTVVEERLAACANLLSPIRSFYWWEGGVKDDIEVALVLKTSEGRTKQLVERIKALHNYDCPGISVMPVIDGNPDFLRWVETETTLSI